MDEMGIWIIVQFLLIFVVGCSGWMGCRWIIATLWWRDVNAWPSSMNNLTTDIHRCCSLIWRIYERICTLEYWGIDALSCGAGDTLIIYRLTELHQELTVNCSWDKEMPFTGYRFKFSTVWILYPNCTKFEFVTSERYFPYATCIWSCPDSVGR